MSAGARTAEEYIASLPKSAGTSCRLCDVVRSNLPDGYKEDIESGMIAWYVPLETFP